MVEKKNSKPIAVESTKHKDTRVNIPTGELRNFVREDELTPRTMLYPRDPSHGPQLVWKGEGEQIRGDLSLPTVPICTWPEVSGEPRKDRAAKVATAKTLWVPAINNNDSFGKWDFIEISDPWDAQNAIRGVL